MFVLRKGQLEDYLPPDVGKLKSLDSLIRFVGEKEFLKKLDHGAMEELAIIVKALLGTAAPSA